MKNLQLFLLLIYLCAASLTAPTFWQVAPPSHVRTKRVVGGVKCQIENFTYLVSFRKPFSKKIFCIGTLVSLKWALTAAHCFDKTSILDTLLEMPSATAGATSSTVSKANQVEKDHIQVLKIDTVYIHTLYDSAPSFRHDIALILLVDPFKLSDWVGIAALGRQNETDRCKKGTFPGWGSTQPKDPFTGGSSFSRTSHKHKPKPGGYGEAKQHLKCAYNMTIASDEECKKGWEWEFIPRATMCTMEAKGKKDPCDEDAGGPLMCGDDGHNKIIMGIYSQNQGCGVANFPTLYTRVDAYLDWIDNTMNTGTDRFTTYKSVIILMLLLLIVMSRSLLTVT